MVRREEEHTMTIRPLSEDDPMFEQFSELRRKFLIDDAPTDWSKAIRVEPGQAFRFNPDGSVDVIEDDGD